MRIDCHVHSKYSSEPSEWILQKLKCPESFTEPLDLYAIAQKKGMTHVTITDHDTINGALDIAHLPNTFVSCELTTYFPEDGCKIHVLVYDITEAQFAFCQKIRRNIYDLVGYLNQQNIFHAVAHPLFAINGKLTYDHFEKLLVLFEILELNGSRNEQLNDALRKVVAGLTPEKIARLMEKHRLCPDSVHWKKKFIGGSDDHSSLHIASRWVEAEDAYDFDSFVKSVKNGHTSVRGAHGSPQGFARTLYSIGYQFYKDKLKLEAEKSDDVLFTVFNRYLLPASNEAPQKLSLYSRVQYYFAKQHRKRQQGKSGSHSIMDIFRFEIDELVERDEEFSKLVQREDDYCRGWSEIMMHVSHRMLARLNTEQLRNLFQARLFNMVHSFGSAAILYFLMAPYFLAYTLFSKDLKFSRTVLRRFGLSPKDSSAEKMKAAHFTDTFYDMNGVAKTIQKQLMITQVSGKDYQVITCSKEKQIAKAGVKNFKPIGTFKFEEYPDQKLYYPPFLEMLNYCYEQGFTHIHTSTPGPIGLAALGIAKILDLPLIGTYHTSFPQYVTHFSHDNSIEKMTWKYMIWYYDQMDLILVPSKHTMDELVEKGISPDKIKIFPRGVDVEVFSPHRKNGVFNATTIEKKKKLLYAGRISVEKNLPLLVDAFKLLVEEDPDVSLVIAGKGPYLAKMHELCEGLPVHFTGHLSPAEMAEVYASSDLFVFPSETDTFGNVVLEAQACGIPALVSSVGGPRENVIHDQTGWILEMESPEMLASFLKSQLADMSALREMGLRARAAMEKRDFKSCFHKTWELYKEAKTQGDDKGAFPPDDASLSDDVLNRLLSSVHP